MQQIPFRQALSIWNNYASDAKIAKKIGTHRQTVSKWHSLVNGPQQNKPYMKKFWKIFYADILPFHKNLGATTAYLPNNQPPRSVAEGLSRLDAMYGVGISGMSWVKAFHEWLDDEEGINDEEFWWKWMPFFLGLETHNHANRHGHYELIVIDADWMAKMDMVEFCLNHQDDEYVIRDLLNAALGVSDIEEAYDMLKIRLGP